MTKMFGRKKIATFGILALASGFLFDWEAKASHKRIVNFIKLIVQEIDKS